ncbi:MAG: hypothetical protein ACUVQ5_04225 [Candidatus Methanomethylicaceae archaeon]
MSVKTTLYYFPNDLFRERGVRITIKDLELIAKNYGTRITAKADKLGAIGPFSYILLKGLQIDILKITVEGEDEQSVKASVREIYSKYGPYEVFRGKESAIAKSLRSELQ